MKSGLRLLALVALVVAAFAAVALTGPLSATRVRSWIGTPDLAAALLFIAVSASLTVACFPGPLLAGAAGLIFGVAAGTGLSICSATLGAVLAFLLARVVAGDAIERLGGARAQRISAWVGQRGFLSVLYARIAPGVPYTLVNYAAGLSRVRLRAFAAATLIGCAPRAYAYAALGGNLGNLTSPQALTAIAILAAMALTGALLAWRRSEILDL